MKTSVITLATLTSMCLLISACGRSSFNPEMPGTLSDDPSEVMSTLTVTDDNVADGMTPANVTLKVLTGKGHPVVGVRMELAVTGSENVIVPCTTTDENGTATCKIYSTKAEEKKISASGKFVLWGDTTFKAPQPMRSAFAFVSSGDVAVLPSRHKIIATSGISETNTVLKDGQGTMRIQSSVLSSIVSD